MASHTSCTRTRTCAHCCSGCQSFSLQSDKKREPLAEAMTVTGRRESVPACVICGRNDGDAWQVVVDYHWKAEWLVYLCDSDDLPPGTHVHSSTGSPELESRGVHHWPEPLPPSPLVWHSIAAAGDASRATGVRVTRVCQRNQPKPSAISAQFCLFACRRTVQA